MAGVPTDSAAGPGSSPGPAEPGAQHMSKTRQRPDDGGRVAPSSPGAAWAPAHHLREAPCQALLSPLSLGTRGEWGGIPVCLGPEPGCSRARHSPLVSACLGGRVRRPGCALYTRTGETRLVFRYCPGSYCGCPAWWHTACPTPAVPGHSLLPLSSLSIAPPHCHRHPRQPFTALSPSPLPTLYSAIVTYGSVSVSRDRCFVFM